MDPITLTLLIVAGLLTAGTTVASGYAQAGQQRASGEIAKQNAMIQTYNAEQAQRRLEQDRRDTIRKYTSVLGEQTAQSGLLGRGPVGSTADILDDQFGQQLDELFRVQKEREQEIYNFKAQAAEAKGRSNMYRQAAGNSITLGWLGGTGELLGSLGGIGSKGGFGGGSPKGIDVGGGVTVYEDPFGPAT